MLSVHVTSQDLVSDLLLLWVWEVGHAGLGRVTRKWHGQQ